MLININEINKNIRTKLIDVYVELFSFGVINSNELAILLTISDKNEVYNDIRRCSGLTIEASEDAVRKLNDIQFITVSPSDSVDGFPNSVNLFTDSMEEFLNRPTNFITNRMINAALNKRQPEIWKLHEFMDKADFLLSFFRTVGSEIIKYEGHYSDSFSVVHNFDIHRMPEEFKMISRKNMDIYRAYEPIVRMSYWEDGIRENIRKSLINKYKSMARVEKMLESEFIEEKNMLINEGEALPEYYGICATPGFADPLVGEHLRLQMSDAQRINRERNGN